MSNLFADLEAEIWAMEPKRLESLFSKLNAYTEKAAMQGEPQSRRRESSIRHEGTTAVISIRGVLMKSVPRWMSWWGIEATSYQELKEDIETAAKDKRVESIVLEIESPGGQVSGIHDAADAIFEARKAKPVQAYVDDLCASGAYWLASQADEIVASRDAMVGSIGVYSVYVDSSKRGGS